MNRKHLRTILMCCCLDAFYVHHHRHGRPNTTTASRSKPNTHHTRFFQITNNSRNHHPRSNLSHHPLHRRKRSSHTRQPAPSTIPKNSAPATTNQSKNHTDNPRSRTTPHRWNNTTRRNTNASHRNTHHQLTTTQPSNIRLISTLPNPTSDRHRNTTVPRIPDTIPRRLPVPIHPNNRTTHLLPKHHYRTPTRTSINPDSTLPGITTRPRRSTKYSGKP